jgi:hypothetical protein
MSPGTAVENYRVYPREGRYIIPVEAGVGDALVAHLRSLGVECRLRRKAGVPGERVRVEQDDLSAKALQTILDHWTR